MLSMCESAQVTISGVGFGTFFLNRGAKTVVGTEGPVPWRLARTFDSSILQSLFRGATVIEAFQEA